MPNTTTDSLSSTATGSCLCGGISYQLFGTLRNIVGCHCEQCRKTSGNFVAATSVNNTDITFLNDETLIWYQSSSQAKRGFCCRCGGNLFWKPLGKDYTSIMAGTLDLPTKLELTHHIYVANASDYMCFQDDVKTYEQED